MMKRWIHALKTHWHRMVQLHDTPHSIAGGTAIGIFFGFTPFFGLKTLLGMAAAWGFRCSPVAAAIGVTLHDVILPLMPVLLRIEYGIGYWLMSHPHHWPAKFHIEHLRIHQWLHAKVLIEVIWPTLIGSIVIGLPLAGASFWLILRIVKRAQHRRYSSDAAALGIDIDRPA